jgi:CheY-like chemotaxis protein
VRAWGAWALGRLAAVDAVGLLTPLLKDPSGRVRFQAHRALALIRVEKDETGFTTQILAKSVEETNQKILVSDDEPELVDLHKLILGKMGYEVVCAPGGERTLALARCELPDLIITDYMNVDMEGTDLIFELRSQIATRKIPIVVVSAEPPDWLAFFWGADIFVQKPFGPRELAPLIGELLAH